ncbi:MAG TPA: ABC transporter ATP-binding protein [Candidatus Acidoferrales bacterium]|nr:ABC transporter ATP-binding protein [Candidatus Acidoferrales bacterium]
MKSLLRLFPYLKKYKTTLILGLLTVVLSNIFGNFVPLIVGGAIDQLRSGPSSLKLIEYAALIISLICLSGFFTFLTRQTIIVTSRKIEFDLVNNFYSHVQKLSYSFFLNTPTGDVMAHATNDISAVRNVLGPGIMYTSDTITGFIMVIAIMFSINVRLTLYSLIPLPFVSAAVYYIGKLVNRHFEDVQAQYSSLTARAQETISGVRIVRSYVREDYETERFKSLSRDYLKKNLILAQVQSILWPLMGMLTGAAGVIVIWRGGLDVIFNTLTLGTMVAFLVYLGLLTWPLIAFGWVINIFQRGAASMGRLNKIFDILPEIKDTAETDHSINEIEGTITFKNVSFRFPSKEDYALRNINIEIERGTTLAIVGRTGNGKTTMVNLIPRLLDCTSGEILIDGIPIRKIPIDALRRSIGYVQQETFLFSDTIANNIAYGVEIATNEDIEWAARVSQIQKDIDMFPHKYDTLVGERGITLSGGQKQRVGIARAIMRKPSILILDDALSAVDTYTEEEILSQLKQVMKERTSIIISHRISTVKDADVIIVLDDGAIAETGTHEELVLKNGIYADLYNRQLLEEELQRM